jgi:hypothetical protein
MQLATDDILRWLLNHQPELWAVVAGGVLLAWLESALAAPKLRRYDAWWFFHLPRSAAKAFQRSRKS